VTEEVDDPLTEEIEARESQVCNICQDGYFLDGTNGCVLECPLGTYADPIFDWCIKCACECSTCDGSRDACTSCNPGSSLDEETGTCQQFPSELPYAIYNDDYQSFDLFYPEARFYFGYRSTFVGDNPDAQPHACKDEILNEDWNSADMNAEKEAILAILMPKLNAHEQDFINTFLNTPHGDANLENYAHDLETSEDQMKMIYFVSDSLFGKDYPEI
jgi:hypothetical protein